MTIQKTIDRFRDLKAHSRTVIGSNDIYSDQNLIAWLWECDATIYEEFIRPRQDPEEPPLPYDENHQTTELLMPAPYDEGYLYWLEYKTKYYEEETEEANNALLLFRDKYDDFRAWYNRRNPTVKKTRLKFW